MDSVPVSAPPSNDAVYSLVRHQVTGGDDDMWVVGSSNYTGGSNLFAYADYAEASGTMSPVGPDGIGLAVGATGTPYAATTTTGTVNGVTTY